MSVLLMYTHGFSQLISVETVMASARSFPIMSYLLLSVRLHFVCLMVDMSAEKNSPAFSVFSCIPHIEICLTSGIY